MKKQFAVFICLGSFQAVFTSYAADLKQSKFTQVVNDVRVISTADNREKPAMVNAIFTMPDLVHTGEASRAELVANDNTITRVGANTIFSFDPANRTIDLQQGSLLFHSPKGKGGGTIRTGSATASVLGTTIIVTTTPNNGFKVIDLEGHVAIKFSNGVQEYLEPGQMTFVLPGGNPAPVITIRLDDLTSNSLLVHGFEQPLPSWALIRQEVDKQIKLIESGQAQDTGLLVGDWADRTTVQVVKLDPNTILGQQKSDEPPTTDNTPPAAPGTINSSILPAAYIVSSPFTVGSFTFPFGFSAPNITIGTPTIDLSPYRNVPEFAFVAPNGTLTINGSVAFNGLSSTAILDLYANQFSFAAGSTVQANVGTFNLYPQTATTLSGVAIVDNAPASSAPAGITAALSSSSPISLPSGGIDFTSPAALSLTNGSSMTAQNLPVHLVASAITLNKSSVQGSFVGLKSTLVTPAGTTGISLANSSSLKATSGNLDLLTVGSGIDISASTLKAVQGASFNGSNTGQVLIAATGGAVNLTNGATISAADALAISSDKGISISGSSVQGGPLVDLFGATGVSIASNSTLTATGGDMDVFTGTGDVNLSASTLKAIAGTPLTSSNDGTIFIYGVGGMAKLTNGTAIAAAGTLLVAGDTGVTISDSSLTSGSGAGTIIGSNGPISVTGSATVTGYTTTFTGNTIISAGTSLNVNGATFNADPTSGSVALSANSGSNTLQNASVTAGTLSLASDGASSLVTVQSASIASSMLTVNAGLISGSGSINVQNSSITAGNSLSLTSGAASGSITVEGSAINAPTITMTTSSAADLLKVDQNTSITTSMLTLNSGDGILLDGTGGLNGGSTGMASLNVDPTNFNGVIAANNADFRSFSSVIMNASTINLNNVHLPTSGVHFTTWYAEGPQFNTQTTGVVNFNGTDYVGTTPITSSNYYTFGILFSGTHPAP
jgi:hypothetical protein